MIKESDILRLIQNSAPYYKCRLFRNNVGMFEMQGRKIKTGLCVGSSDLIGYTTKTITPDMVGEEVAIFTSIEVKKPEWKKSKKLTPHELNQKQFLDNVNDNGGLAGFANSSDDFINIIKE